MTRSPKSYADRLPLVQSLLEGRLGLWSVERRRKNSVLNWQHAPGLSRLCLPTRREFKR